jgi:hypothetical protein
LLEMRYSMFSAQLTTPGYRSTNWLTGLNLNIAVNTSQFYRLTEFWSHSVHCTIISLFHCCSQWLWFNYMTTTLSSNVTIADVINLSDPLLSLITPKNWTFFSQCAGRAETNSI